MDDFEENNDIGINLIGLVDDVIYRVKKARWKHEKIVTLHFHVDRYYIMKNISRLWSSQINKRNAAGIFCNHCLKSFYSEIGYDKHLSSFRMWEREILEEEPRRA